MKTDNKFYIFRQLTCLNKRDFQKVAEYVDFLSSGKDEQQTEETKPSPQINNILSFPGRTKVERVGKEASDFEPIFIAIETRQEANIILNVLTSDVGILADLRDDITAILNAR